MQKREMDPWDGKEGDGYLVCKRGRWILGMQKREMDVWDAKAQKLRDDTDQGREGFFAPPPISLSQQSGFQRKKIIKGLSMKATILGGRKTSASLRWQSGSLYKKAVLMEISHQCQ